MRNQKVLFIVQAAMIAAIYVVLTYLTNLLHLASGVIQVRFSEALCILPFFTPAAIPGLFLGCLVSNLLTGGIIWDVVFGSLATLLGALGTRYFSGMNRKKDGAAAKVHGLLALLSPIAANTIIIPPILYYAYGFPGSIPYFMLTVGAGEIISCGILGFLLLKILGRYQKYIF